MRVSILLSQNLELPVSGKLWIAGKWVEGSAEEWERPAPSDGRVVWQGQWASAPQTHAAIEAAASAFRDWSLRPLEERIGYCEQFAEQVEQRQDELAQLIALENGKPFWEAKTEVAASIAKVKNSRDSIYERRWTKSEKIGDFSAVTRFRPHGVMFVIGPFNFPSHVPGGHIIPALMAGNTVVFKPSEYVSAVGQWLVQRWEETGLPAGVLNLVHGAGVVGKAAVDDQRVDGILFTGSQKVGTSLHRQMAGQPQRVLALEMGGNNSLVVHETQDIHAAAVTCILSAFITSGQRCTCTRRLIVSGQATYQKLVDELERLIPRIQVGLSLADPQPFMGPLIHAGAAEQMLEAEEDLLKSGARSLIRMKVDATCPALLSPALLEVDGETNVEDCERFGPLLMVRQAASLEEAVQLAGHTNYGLSAGFIGDRESDFHYFLDHVRAGVINWNRQTTGASGRLPFGGVGQSGNHHPSGYHAADYCSYPIASLESPSLSEAHKPVPGLEFGDD